MEFEVHGISPARQMKQITGGLLLFLMGCSSPDITLKLPLTIARMELPQQIRDPADYPATKQNIIAAIKAYPVNQYPLDSLFINIVCDSIIPYWPGTKWDFNGTTETPQSGSIACGYFVTTVLRDAGVPLNRVSLAQLASEAMIQKLVNEKYIKRYSNMSQADFITGIKQSGKGLYIIGLDNHTGFIYYNNEGTWFIHSSVVTPGTVAWQDATNNAILYYSKYRVTGKISGDSIFLKKWYAHLKE